MKVPFLKPRLIGARFEQGSIPVDVLRDWAAFRDLVVEVAGAVYLAEHPGRRRLPRGFAAGFALHLSAIEKGSAVPVIERVAMDNLLLGPDLFDRSRDLILDEIESGSREGREASGFFAGTSRYFDLFGRSLADDEYMELSTTVRAKPVRYDRAVRKRLVLAGATQYHSVGELRGTIGEVDREKRRYRLTTDSGHRVTGRYPAEMLDTLVAALEGTNQPEVIVRGTVVYDATDRPRKIEDTHDIEILDPGDLTTRLLELSRLQEGWLDGAGKAPDTNGLRWLADRWATTYPENLPTPYVYPTPEGGVQMEWTLGDWEVSVEIDLAAHRGAMQAVEIRSDIGIDHTLNLDLDDEWEILNAEIRTRSAK